MGNGDAFPGQGGGDLPDQVYRKAFEWLQGKDVSPEPPPPVILEEEEQAAIEALRKMPDETRRTMLRKMEAAAECRVNRANDGG